jgi:hypothetical protein
VTPAENTLASVPVDEHRLARCDVVPPVAAAALASLAVPTVASAQEVYCREGQRRHRRRTGRAVALRIRRTYTALNTAPGGVQPSTAKGIYVFKMNGRTGGLDKAI